ncbi:tetratricopeptide repeat protein [Rickettsia asembonensis]|uniref:tetratricopeptide repeat protein n=1 Tax=Rickettsia asembonensis TaxID=1068590 RepID=UPI0023FA09AC|nr:tetratricopeptide repeat protein [Rickettsia asembonensis]WCR56515.1 MAG: hypothetical protein PG979_000572 [Rickettsia asembonensis]
MYILTKIYLKFKHKFFQKNILPVILCLIPYLSTLPLSNPSKGLKYLKEALKIYQELYPSNHPGIAIFLNNIGEAYRDLVDVSKGITYLEKMLKIYQELYQGNHYYIAQSFNNISTAFITIQVIQTKL